MHLHQLTLHMWPPHCSGKQNELPKLMQDTLLPWHGFNVAYRESKKTQGCVQRKSASKCSMCSGSLFLYGFAFWVKPSFASPFSGKENVLSG